MGGDITTAIQIGHVKDDDYDDLSYYTIDISVFDGSRIIAKHHLVTDNFGLSSDDNKTCIFDHVIGDRRNP